MHSTFSGILFLLKWCCILKWTIILFSKTSFWYCSVWCSLSRVSVLTTAKMWQVQIAASMFMFLVYNNPFSQYWYCFPNLFSPCHSVTDEVVWLSHSLSVVIQWLFKSMWLLLPCMIGCHFGHFWTDLIVHQHEDRNMLFDYFFIPADLYRTSSEGRTVQLLIWRLFPSFHVSRWRYMEQFFAVNFITITIVFWWDRSWL